MSRKKHTPKENERGKYIMCAMDAINKAGDIYTYEDELLQACREENRFLSYEEFHRDLRFLMREQLLHMDGRRIYVQYDWAYQCAVGNLPPSAGRRGGSAPQHHQLPCPVLRT